MVTANISKARCARLRLIAVVMAFFALGNALHAEQPASASGAHDKLVVTGSLTLYRLVTDIARRFEALHPGVSIDVQSGGSAKAQLDLRAGVSDIAMVPRALRSSDHDLFSFPIARDGIAVIVNAENPVRGLNADQLAGIITGRISNWKALGGPDAPIRLALRDEIEGSTDRVLEHLNLRWTQITKHASAGTTVQAIKFVAASADAAALASIGEAERSARAGIPIKLLAYNGFPAASRTIHNHLYALSRPMTLVTRKPPEGVQKQFIDYATSTAVVDLLLKYGFVPYDQ